MATEEKTQGTAHASRGAFSGSDGQVAVVVDIGGGICKLGPQRVVNRPVVMENVFLF